MIELQEEQKPVGNGKEMPYRYDGKLKVTGKARYAAEFAPDIQKDAGGKTMLYAYLVQATVPSGEILAMDTTAADRASGVVKILTPFNAPKLPIVAPKPPAVRTLSLLQDRTVYYNGEPIGVVIAKSQVEAAQAAALIKVRYKQAPAKLDFDHRLNEARKPKSASAPVARKPGEADAIFFFYYTVM